MSLFHWKCLHCGNIKYCSGLTCYSVISLLESKSENIYMTFWKFIEFASSIGVCSWFWKNMQARKFSMYLISHKVSLERFLYHIVVWSFLYQITQSNPVQLRSQPLGDAKICRRHWLPRWRTIWSRSGRWRSSWIPYCCKLFCWILSLGCPKASSHNNEDLGCLEARSLSTRTCPGSRHTIFGPD